MPVIESKFLNGSPIQISGTLRKKKDESIKSDVYLATVPKSGTHLLIKIFKLLNINWSYENSVMHLHRRYDRNIAGEPLRKIFEQNSKYVVSYRDPRDLIVSHLNYIMQENVSSPKERRLLSQHSFSELITRTIKFEGKKPDEPGWRGHRLFHGLEMVLKLKDKNFSNCYLVRFEDVVPTFAGGADASKRFKIFKEICNFAGKKSSIAKIHNAMEKCWGNSRTFNPKEKQKVGQWKRYFSYEHCELLQKKYNHLLLGLGYETDPNWHLKYSEANEQGESKTA